MKKFIFLILVNIFTNIYSQNSGIGFAPYSYNVDLSEKFNIINFDNPSSKQYTILTCEYHNKYKSENWYNISRDTFIFDIMTESNFKLIKAENVPTSPDRRTIPANAKQKFKLFFEKIPKESFLFDFVEKSGCSTCFNYKLIDIRYSQEDRANIYQSLNKVMPYWLIFSFFKNLTVEDVITSIQTEKENFDRDEISEIKVIEAQIPFGESGNKEDAKIITYSVNGKQNRITYYTKKNIMIAEIIFNSAQEATKQYNDFIKYSMLIKEDENSNYTFPLDNLKWIIVEGNKLIIFNITQYQ